MTGGALPTIVVAGVMRCGTTSLHELLADHPQIHGSAVKEPHHFAWPQDPPPGVGPGDRAFLEQVIVERDRYRALFVGGEDDRHRVESSAMYLHVDGTHARLYEAIPDVHVVVLLRDPVRRAHSAWAYQRMRTFEPLDDFGEALNAEPDRLAAGWLPIWAYRGAGRYASALAPWRDRFGDRLHVLFLEELIADPRRTLTDLGVRLDITPDWPDSLPAANVSGVPRRGWLQRALQWRPPGSGRLIQALPELLVEPLRGMRDRNVASAPPPDPSTIARLQADYRTGIDDLEMLLGRAVPDAWRR